MGDAFDLAVVGSPFLDLTFAGLPRLPGSGEEVVGEDLHWTPGGTGMTAIGASRLGLRVALVSPRGTDPGGRILAGLFDDEGVTWEGAEHGRTATTAILPSDGGAAMATVLGAAEPSQEDVAAAGAPTVVLSLGGLRLRPPGAEVYATTGTIELDGGTGPLLERLAGVRALVVNETEIRRLTGLDDPAIAAAALGPRAGTVVITRGPRGALAVEAGRTVEAAAPEVDTVDATGAGDLFVAAYAWADRGGLALEDRLAWACLYAALSVRAPTPLAGAVRLGNLLDEGARRGLTPPG